MISPGIGLVGGGVVGVISFQGVQLSPNVEQAVGMKGSCYVQAGLSGAC